MIKTLRITPPIQEKIVLNNGTNIPMEFFGKMQSFPATGTVLCTKADQYEDDSDELMPASYLMDALCLFEGVSKVGSGEDMKLGDLLTSRVDFHYNGYEIKGAFCIVHFTKLDEHHLRLGEVLDTVMDFTLHVGSVIPTM